MFDADFVENVNNVSENMIYVKEASDLFDAATVELLGELSEYNLNLITDDLYKGNYLGNRKIDIDLALNNTSTETEVTYQGATITTNTGAVIQIDFESSPGVIEELASYTAIYNAITDGIDAWNLAEPDEQLHVVGTEIDIINSTLPELPTMIRFRDEDGSASSIDRIQLQVYNGSAIDANPAYFWAKTTSSLQTLANRVGDIIALGNDIDSIILLASKNDEIQYLYDNQVQLQALYDDLQVLINVEANLAAINSVNDNSTNINSVEANEGNINLVATNETNINIVAGIDAEIESVVANEININAVNSNKTNIDTVATNNSNVTAVGSNIDNVNDVALNETNINAVQAKLSDIATVVTNIQAVINAATNAGIASDKADEALSSAQSAASSAGIATTQAELATTKSDEIKAVSVASTVTGAAGTNAAVTYNSADGKFTFIIPKGLTGDRGEAFQVNSVGLLADKSLYDAQLKGFSFLAIDTAEIYFKLSDTSGDWSIAAPFGKGDTGDTGATGVGIADIALTDGDNSPGTTDTYTITYTDTTTDTFTVYNGTEYTAEDIKVAYESNDNTNAFTDNDKSKMDTVDTLAEAIAGLSSANASISGTGDILIPINASLVSLSGYTIKSDTSDSNVIELSSGTGTFKFKRAGKYNFITTVYASAIDKDPTISPRIVVESLDNLNVGGDTILYDDSMSPIKVKKDGILLPTSVLFEITDDMISYVGQGYVEVTIKMGHVETINADEQVKVTGFDSVLSTMSAIYTGFADHDKLGGLDAANSHPISAITNLQTTLNSKLVKINPSITGSITEQVAVCNLALEPDNGTVQTYTAAANTTFTDGLADGQFLTLILTNGGFTVTFPTITWWNAEPTLGTTDKIFFEKIGGVLYGTQVGTIV